MKFPRLPIGAKFSWRGEAFQKNAPLSARSLKDGATRMIPRSADVQPLEDSGASVAGDKPLSPADGQRLVEALWRVVERETTRQATPEALREAFFGCWEGFRRR